MQRCPTTHPRPRSDWHLLPIAARVGQRDGAAWAERVTVYRTARRLMEGYVRVP